MGKERTILKIFWDLASAKSEVRVIAAAELISALQVKKELEAMEPQDAESTEMSMMDYSVQRLVRGLSSSRRGAREGFSIALAEVLHRFSEVPTESILRLMESELSITGQLKPSEERDLSFGRLFCVGALLQGGRLGSGDYVIASHLLQDVLSNSKRKSYMTQLGIKLIESILENVRQKEKQIDKKRHTISPHSRLHPLILSSLDVCRLIDCVMFAIGRV
jgi:DNA polymerase phi